MWKNGTVRKLGTFGGRYSGATDINDSRQIVGDAQGKGSVIYDEAAVAFLWQNGKLRRLEAPWGFLEARRWFRAEGCPFL